jgi:hypothetical protein
LEGLVPAVFHLLGFFSSVLPTGFAFSLTPPLLSSIIHDAEAGRLPHTSLISPRLPEWFQILVHASEIHHPADNSF